MIVKRKMWAIKSQYPGQAFCCAYAQDADGEWLFFPIALYGTRADARRQRSDGVVKVEVTVRVMH